MSFRCSVRAFRLQALLPGIGLQDLVTLLTDQEIPMKTSSVAVLAWPGRWPDAQRRLCGTTPRG